MTFKGEISYCLGGIWRFFVLFCFSALKLHALFFTRSIMKTIHLSPSPSWSEINLCRLGRGPQKCFHKYLRDDSVGTSLQVYKVHFM